MALHLTAEKVQLIFHPRQHGHGDDAYSAAPFTILPIYSVMQSDPALQLRAARRWGQGQPRHSGASMRLRLCRARGGGLSDDVHSVFGLLHHPRLGGVGASPNGVELHLDIHQPRSELGSGSGTGCGLADRYLPKYSVSASYFLGIVRVIDVPFR